MPALLHSPADVIRQLLVSAGQGTEPEANGSWPAFSAGESDSPDNALFVRDTEGLDFGRAMFDGERQQFRGFQVTVRARTHDVGKVKAEALATYFDETVYDDEVALDGTGYVVHAVTRTSDVMYLGKEKPESARSLFVINGITTIRKLD